MTFRTFGILFLSLIIVGLGLWGAGFFSSPQVVSEEDQRDFMIAVETNDLKYTRWLLINGMSPDTRNKKKVTALCLAAKSGHLKMVHLLLSAGADENLKSPGLGRPLNCSAAGGQAKVVKFLSQFMKAPTPKLDCRFPFCRRSTDLQ